MKGIIFATESEAHPFLQHYRDGALEGMTEGEPVQDDHVVVLITGPGKIKATLRTEQLLGRIRPDALLHAGSCHALREPFAPGMLVAAQLVVEGDRMDIPHPNYPRMPLEVPFTGISAGTLVSQDRQAEPTEKALWHRLADVVDTTGYAVAYVAAMHGVPCQIVKLVSDKERRVPGEIPVMQPDAMTRFLLEYAT